MPKRFIPLGEMARDISDYDSPLLDEARNVLPIYGIYRPIRESKIVSTFPAPGSSLTPWIEFDGTAGGKVDFASNPWVSIGNEFPFFAMAVRFRTTDNGRQMLIGCGMDDFFEGTSDFGWGLGFRFEGGLRAVMARGLFPGGGDSSKELADTPLRGGNDGEWHVGVLASFPVESSLAPRELIVALDDSFQREFYLAAGVEGAAWDALPMRWGLDAAGLYANQGDFERVMTWNGQGGLEDLGSPSTAPGLVAAITERMDQPLDNVADGSWGPGHLWLLRENAGVTVNDFAETNPLDGTMDTGATWEGDDFGTVANASGITGGIAHYYTAQQGSLSRGPVSDIRKGAWRTFGGIPLPGEEPEEGEFPAGQIYSRLNEKVADDSQGAILGIPPQGLPNPSIFEVRLKDVPEPTTDDDHIVAYRYRFNGKADEEGQPFTEMTLAPFLYQGMTEIAALTPVTVTTADEEWHHVVEELSPTDVANITNYANLRIVSEGEIVDGVRQLIRPVEDLQNPDGWVNEDGESENLWESIADFFEPGNDDTFAETPGIVAGATTRYRFKLAEADNPRNPNNYNANVRVQAVTQGIDATFILFEGNREIQRWTATDIPTTPTTYQNEVSAQRANTIQDFENLAMQVVFKSVTGGTPTGGGVTPQAFDGPLVNTTGTIPDLQEDDNQTVDTGAGGDGGRFRVTMAAGQDPGVNTGHSIFLRAHRTGGNASVSVQLFSGPTLVFDSRSVDGDFGRPLPTSESNVSFPIPPSAVQQIQSYANLRIQVLTHASPSGGVGHYDLLEFRYPGAGQGGRKARLIHAVLGLASRAWIGVSWARFFVPDPEARERNDITELYAGNYTQLLRVTDEGFEDVSKAGGYAASGVPRSWAMTSFGDNVVATNKIDPVQVITPTDTEFDDLITSDAKPQFAALAVCKNHLVGFNIEYTDAGQGSGPNGRPDEWWASAFDAPEDFDISLATGSNRRPIRHPAGEVIAAVGGEFILAFKENSIHRLDYVGSGLLPDGSVRPTFREDVVSSTAGTKFPRSLVQVDRDVYFLDTDGFHVVRNGQYVEDIGVDKVNRMVTDTAFELRAVQPVDTDEIPVADSIAIGAYDQLTGLIWWALRATGSEGGDPDPIWRNGTFVLYNPKEDRWAVVELTESPETETDDLTATHLWTMPSAAQASTSFARGVGILSIDGPYPLDFQYRFRRFLGIETYEAFFRTKVWSSQFISGSEPGQELTMNSIRPSYRMAPEASARPNISIRVRAADDPLMQFDIVEDEVDLEDANEGMWFPLVDVEGEYFQFEITIPRLVNETIREIRGIELNFEPAGTDES